MRQHLHDASEPLDSAAREADSPEGIDHDGYGLRIKTRRDALDYCPGVLLIFVHGINSDARDCWGSLPRVLLRKANIGIDVHLFQYPSRFLEKTSLADAGDLLYTFLETVTHRTLLFVCHSAGGLVYKQLVVKAHEENNTLLLSRIRTAVTIAVPHAGAQPGGAELLRRSVVLLQNILLRLPVALRRSWGRNEILEVLRSNHPTLAHLERQYSNAQSRMNGGPHNPQPTVIDVKATNDLFAAPGQTKGSIKLIRALIGDHRTVKLLGPEQLLGPENPVLVNSLTKWLALSELLEEWRNSADLAVAETTVGLVKKLETQVGVNALIGPTRPSHPSATIPDERHVGSQLSILDALKGRARALGPQAVVVKGATGVGKTVVLRRLALELAECFLESAKANAPLPIWIPLGRLGALEDDSHPGKRSPDRMWRGLFSGWTRLAMNAVRYQKTARSVYIESLCYSWYGNRLEEGATVLILDGVDEFLRRPAGVTIDEFMDGLDYLKKLCQEIPGLCVILGVRDTQIALDKLYAQNSDLYEISALTLDQASRHLPRINGVLENLRTERAKTAILTPLILSHLDRVNDLDLRSEADVLRAGLEGLLRWSGVADLDNRVRTLAAVAWVFFCDYKRYNDDVPTRELRRTREDPVLKGYDLPADDAALQRLCSKPPLRQPRQDSVVFLHEAWYDLLVAIYVADGIRRGDVSVLAQRAFAWHYYRLIAELLDDFVVGGPLVELALSHRSRYVVGNFLTILGYSSSGMRREAFKKILGSLEDMEALARHVALTRFGWRSLREQEDDRGAALIRSMLGPLLPTYSRRGELGGLPAVTASLAWCYGAVLARRGDGVKGEHPPWPGLAKEDSDETLFVLLGSRETNREPTAQEQSLLEAFLLYAARSIPGEKALIVGAVHYLYFLAVALEKGVYRWEVQEKLHGILEEESSAARFVEGYEEVPELWEIFQLCRRIIPAPWREGPTAGPVPSTP